MRAVVQERYGAGDVLGLREVETPTVADDEVLVGVRAASVHPDVWHVLRGRPRMLRLMGAGLLRPRDTIPGTDVAGIVESAGKDVTRFRPGDAVLGETVRGHQWRNGGAYAEHVAVPEDGLVAKPADITFEQAATVPTAGLIAMGNVLPHRGKLGPGRRVLVNGAAGGVGSIALQIAKAHGAEVTGVDHTAKLDLVRSLGADHTIDYTREDFTRRGVHHDLIVDIPGNHPFSECRRALATDGVYVLIGHDRFGQGGGGRWMGSIPRVLGLVVRSLVTKQLPRPDFSAPDKPALLGELARLLADGALTPIVDRTYPLADTAEAIRHLESGTAKGRIVITP